MITKREAKTNTSIPITDGSYGKKKTDPIINKILPIVVKNALNEPIFCKGFNGVNSGSIDIPRISQLK